MLVSGSTNRIVNLTSLLHHGKLTAETLLFMQHYYAIPSRSDFAPSGASIRLSLVVSICSFTEQRANDSHFTQTEIKVADFSDQSYPVCDRYKNAHLETLSQGPNFGMLLQSLRRPRRDPSQLRRA